MNMAETRSSTLQSSYLVYANNLRCEAKLCDIILYVKGKMGAMVGYPAHKLLLISASKYFRLLFEREDLRNYCHFPHLSEEGVFAVLDIIYGREIRQETNLDDALMAARFLQVDCAVDVLEQKREDQLAEQMVEAEAASPDPVGSGDTAERFSIKRKFDMSDHKERSQRQKTRTTESPSQQQSHTADSPFSQTDHSSNNTQDAIQDNGTDPALVKQEPDVDLTMDNEENSGLAHLGFGQGGPVFPGEDFARLQMDSVSTRTEGGSNVYMSSGQAENMYASGEMANAGIGPLATTGFNVVGQGDGNQTMATAGGTLIHIFTAPLDISQYQPATTNTTTTEPPPQFSTVDIKCLNPHPSVLQQIEDPNSSSPWQEMLNDSHSRPNFAWKIVKTIFGHDELRGRNCHGRAGKQRLDQDKLNTVRDLTFKWMPLDEATEEEASTAWRQCEIAIDKGIRNMFPKPNPGYSATPEKE